MAWFKIDDGFYDNPKVKAIPRGMRMECLGLWVTAGTWASKHLTDGDVPAFMVDEFGADVSHGDMLVQVGLWRRNEDGYAFHDWLEYQPSRASTLAFREKERARKEAYRSKKAGNTGQSPDGTSADGGGTVPDVSGLPDPTRPDPTRPTNTSPKGEVARKRATRIPEPFIVTPDMRKWASGEVPGVDVDYATRMFVDYWRAESGQKATKRDWVSTWRNWLRRDQPRHHQRPSRTSNELEAFALLGGDKHDRAGSPRALDPGEQG